MEEEIPEFVNTPVDPETFSALEFIRISREYTARTDAVRYAIKRTARLLGWNAEAVTPTKKAKVVA